jgi:hypothetical protein
MPEAEGATQQAKSSIYESFIEEPTVDESAAEHLRNALQILNSPAGTLGTFKRGASCLVFTREEIASIRARIQNALDICETPHVLAGVPLARFLDDLVLEPGKIIELDRPTISPRVRELLDMWKAARLESQRSLAAYVGSSGDASHAARETDRQARADELLAAHNVCSRLIIDLDLDEWRAFDAEIEAIVIPESPTIGDHGSPELNADAEKLVALGADPGLTVEDLEIDDLVANQRVV